jgi:hypothetical protein
MLKDKAAVDNGQKARAADTLHAALRYPAAGLGTVFPLRGKYPAIRQDEGGQGFRDATADADQIIAWWTGRYAGFNIGLRPPPGVVIVDVDPRDRGDVELARLLNGRTLVPTLTATTGRGHHGLHALYRMGLNRPRRDLCHGVQLKGHDSGYILAAPSAHPDTGGLYRWDNALPIADAPGWLIELCRKPTAEALPRPTTTRRPPGAGQHRRLVGLLNAVLLSPVGERNNRLFWAACRAGEHITGGRLDRDLAHDCLLRAATTVGLGEGAAKATIASALDTTAATS